MIMEAQLPRRTHTELRSKKLRRLKWLQQSSLFLTLKNGHGVCKESCRGGRESTMVLPIVECHIDSPILVKVDSGRQAVRVPHRVPSKKLPRLLRTDSKWLLHPFFISYFLMDGTCETATEMPQRRLGQSSFSISTWRESMTVYIKRIIPWDFYGVIVSIGVGQVSGHRINDWIGGPIFNIILKII